MRKLEICAKYTIAYIQFFAQCKLPSDSAIFFVKAWVLELPGVYLLIGVDWVGFQSLTSNIYGALIQKVSLK